MTVKRLDTTKNVYEDPIVVTEYLKAYGKNFHNELARTFTKSLAGRKIIDLGCGPGHYSNYFAGLGFETTGVDYSKEMIRKAKESQTRKNFQTFVVADMRIIDRIFEKNSFDGLWANASLLHIPKEDMQKVLEGIHQIVKDEGKVFISLKKGKQGEKIVQENRYGKKIKRKFTFWEKDKFESILIKTQFKINRVEEIQEGVTGTKPTNWLRFFLEVEK